MGLLDIFKKKQEKGVTQQQPAATPSPFKGLVVQRPKEVQKEDIEKASERYGKKFK